MVETLFILVFIISFFIIGIRSSILATQKKAQTSENYSGIRITLEKLPLVKVDDEVFNQAKSILVACGYTATESKKLLLSVGHHDDANEWVASAMRSVKI